MRRPSSPDSGGVGFWICILGALVVGWCADASAQERQRVLVLDPAAPTTLERELLTRLVGELGAAGVDVIRLPLPPGSDPAAAVATQGSELAAVAAFAAQESAAADPRPARPRLRLWLADRVTGTVLVEEGQEVEGSPVTSSLAVQGFELLQARVADWRLRPPAPAPPEPAAPPKPPEAPAVRVAAELTASLHVGLLYDTPSGETALSPMVRVAYAPGLTRGLAGGVDLGVRLSVAGLGAPTVLDAADRHVDVVQSFALLDAVVTLGSGGWLRPYGSAGAGAYHVDVNGVGTGAVVGRSEDTLSPLAGAGLGLALQPLRHWFGHVEAQGLFAVQPTTVAIGATRTTFGRPLLVFSTGFGVAW